MEIELYQSVRLITDKYAEEGLTKGMIGTILERYDDENFEVDNVYDTVVLGNNMDRVTSMALDIGATYYGGYRPLNALNDTTAYILSKLIELL